MIEQIHGGHNEAHGPRTRQPCNRPRGCDHGLLMTMPSLPAELGYRMPAEWEPHEATWIAWPHERSDWPGKFAAIPHVYTEIVRHLQASETVRILVNDADAERQARRTLSHARIDLARVEFYRFPTNRVWTRDYGPIFIRNDTGDIAVTDWKFNAWSKYRNWQRDDAIAAKAAGALRLRVWQPSVAARRVVLEGGSI